MPFGAFITGQPGSGKSTLTRGIRDYLESGSNIHRRRKTILVNLDPSSLPPSEDSSYYSFDIQRDLIGSQEVMENEGLGPNGALLFCMEYLESQIDSFCKKITSSSFVDEDNSGAEDVDDVYYIFDLPGQAELVTCHYSLQRILAHMEKAFSFRIVVLHLTDSTGCQDSNRFVASLMASLQTMLMLERPQLNLLSKFDLIEQGGPLPLRVEEYLDLSNLPIIPSVNDKLSSALTELICDVGLLSLIPVAIEDVTCISYLVGEMDKANGFVYIEPKGSSSNEGIQGISVREGLRDSLIEHCKERYTKTMSDKEWDLLHGDD